MPTTLGSVAVFIVFLAPGFVFTTRRRRLADLPPPSNLVELATFVIVSTLANILTALVYVIAHSLCPTSWDVPNVADAISKGQPYLTGHLEAIIGWSIGFLAVSCSIAYYAAGEPRWGIRRVFPAPFETDSSWSFALEREAFEGGKPRVTMLGMELRDGSFVTGRLQYYSTERDEVQDRDLVVATPIKVWRPDKADGEDVGYPRLVVSARDIRLLYVWYESPVDSPVDSPPTALPKCQTWRKWWNDRPPLR